MTGIGVYLIGGGSPVCDEAAGSVSHDGRRASAIVGAALTESPAKIPEALESWIKQQSGQINIFSGAEPLDFENHGTIVQMMSEFLRSECTDRNEKYAEFVRFVEESKAQVVICRGRMGGCDPLGTEGAAKVTAYLSTDPHFDMFGAEPAESPTEPLAEEKQDEQQDEKQDEEKQEK